MADKHGLNVGDQLVLRVVGGDSEEEPWTVSGIVFAPYASFSGAGPPPVPGDESIFATFEDAQAIAGFVGFSAFYVRYIDFPTAKEQSDSFYASIAQETPYVPVFNLLDDPAESFLITGAGELTGIMSFLGVIAMVVSGLLIVNIINSIVGEQKRQIGVMKSLGATRWDNFVMYVGIAMTYGLAFKLISAVTSDEANTRQAVGSTHLGLLKSQATYAPYVENRLLTEVLYMLEFTTFIPNNPNWDAYNSAWFEGMQAVESGDMTAAEAVDFVVDRMQAELGDKVIIR